MNRIGLASGVLPEFQPETVIAAAADAGFDDAGLWIEPAEWTDARIRAAKKTIAAAGIGIVDVEALWLKPDSVMADHRRALDIGAALGAKNALCVISDKDFARAGNRYAALCAHAEGVGLRVALEFGIFTEVKTPAMARAIVDAARSPAAAILVDPIHVDRCGAGAADIAAIPRALLPYAQFCDAGAARPAPDDFDAIIVDAVDLRQQLGEGVLPLADILRALPKDIPLSMELRSKALRDRYPGPTPRARAVLEATRKWLEANA
jgi:sugar phosphate isomerase/epimerase